MMQKEINPKAFLGKGWKFPPSFTNSFDEGIQAQMVEYDEDIKESISLILQTRVGERVLKPKFGSELETMIFHSATQDTQIKVQDMVARALFDNEPRIKVDNIESEIEENTIFVHIFYTIIQTNVRANMVYPFYLEEGTYIDKV